MNIEKQREAIRKHYRENKQYYYDKNARRKEQLRQLIQSFKDVPCADCGIKYPYYVMDFDHRENKKYNVSKMWNLGSERKIREEVAKCDVVCSNCHRERTFNTASYRSGLRNQ